MANTNNPDVIVKKLEIAWNFLDKRGSSTHILSVESATEQCEIFKAVYKAISEAVEDNDREEEGR